MRAKPVKEKTFAFHWGSGIVEEEVQVDSEYHRPTIQLLRYTAGEAKGGYSVRFCHYDHRGRFQRSPLMVGAKDIAALAKAMERTPKLRRLMQKLVQG
jgi:hypothetical protein